MTRLRGLLAALFTAALVVGIPLALAHFVGWPLPTTMPDWASLLRTQVSSSVIVDVFAVVLWLAWLNFVVCLIVEFKDAIGQLRGRPARAHRRRVPLNFGGQHLARRLVMSILIGVVGFNTLNTTAVMAAPRTTVSATAQTMNSTVTGPVVLATPAASSALVSDPATTRTVDATANSAGAADTAAPLRLYTVDSPGNHHSDNLWDIAEVHLGDPLRWREIWDLNQQQVMNDGDRFTEPDLIRPGWTLRMPADAVGLPTVAEAHISDQPTSAGENAPSTTPQAQTQAPLQTQLQAQGGGNTTSEQAQGDVAQPTAPQTAPTPQTSGAQATTPNSDAPSALPTSAPITEQPEAGHEKPGAATGNDTAPETTTETTTAGTTVPSPVVPTEGQNAPEQATSSMPAQTEDQVPEHGAHGLGIGPTSTATTTSGMAASSSSASAATTGNSADNSADNSSDDSLVRTAGGVGALLAAGVLSVLGGRRMRQRARRRAGFRAPRPQGRDAEVERDLLNVQAPLTLEAIDLGLRELSSRLVAEDRPLPEIVTARVTGTDLQLLLADATPLPTPWQQLSDDATLWALPNAGRAAAKSSRLLDDVAAPWPSLVTIGHDDTDAQVLVDLEHVRAFNVHATEGEQTESLLNALALELATTPWGEGLRVTLVGCCSDLPALVPNRLRYLEDVDALIGELETHRDDVLRVLHDSGLDGVDQARQQGIASDVWSPEIILLAQPLDPAQREHLDVLLQDRPRVGIAAVTTGSDMLGKWAMTTLPTDATRAVVAPLGIELRPQRLGGQEYASILQILATADLEPTVEAPALFTSPVDEPHLDQPVVALNVIDLTALELHATDEDLLAASIEGSIDANTDTDDNHTIEPNEQDALDEPNPHSTEPTRQTASARSESAAAEDVTDALARAGFDSRLPLIRILGAVEAERDGRPIVLSGRLLALACYLQLNPGATMNDLSHDFYGKPTAATTIHPRIAELRRELGAHPDSGEQLVPRNTDDIGYRLHDDVKTDWELLLHLAQTDDTDAMETALSLVRGTPFAHVGTRYVRYYHWTADTDAQIRDLVVDLAITVSIRRYEAGEYRRAKQAAATGLLLEPGQEALRRAHCRALFQLREFEALQISIEELSRINDEIDSTEDPETIELIDELRAHGALRVA